MTRTPTVTVLMPVYNGELYIRYAIDSILCQSFKDFELLIVNDASTDRTVEIIESYTDSRIRLVHNEINLKHGVALNRGLELAQGQYIARMDSDDISCPARLEKQKCLHHRRLQRNRACRGDSVCARRGRCPYFFAG